MLLGKVNAGTKHSLRHHPQRRGLHHGNLPHRQRKDEQKYGEYRTKRVILEIYDAMAEAIRTGEPYCTLLDPPPADPRVAHEAKKGVSE